jgi:steroid 5-alpha reductase family enzyme
MAKDYFNIVVAYSISGAFAVLIGCLANDWQPLLQVAAADLTGTILIFGFSLFFNNSSVYDPYWSVAPIFIALFWVLSRPVGVNHWSRPTIVILLVFIWGIRLTWNWAVRWQGGSHEDWRYQDIRARCGRGYWPVSFLGIHLMPTVLVFLGCLSLYPILTAQKTLHVLDGIAALVTISAIWIEARADRDLNYFTQQKTSNQGLLHTGLWSLSRHPNYLGEIMFWWGLFLFAMAANPTSWWTMIGPLSITALFVFISIPMIEKRLLARKPEYAGYIQTTPALIPWRWKNKRIK